VTPPRPTPNQPQPVAVRVGADGPVTIDGERVEQEIESWIVEDRWWTEEPVHRRYWELVTQRGHCVVVFHDLKAGGWFTHAA
jgi:hypothetical protein